MKLRKFSKYFLITIFLAVLSSSVLAAALTDDHDLNITEPPTGTYVSPDVNSYDFVFTIRDLNFTSLHDVNVSFSLSSAASDFNIVIAGFDSGDTNADAYCGSDANYFNVTECTFSWAITPAIADGNFFIDINTTTYLNSAPADANTVSIVTANNDLTLDTASPTNSNAIPTIFTPVGEATPVFSITVVDVNGTLRHCAFEFWIDSAFDSKGSISPSAGTCSGTSPTLAWQQEVYISWKVYDQAWNFTDTNSSSFEYSLAGSGGDGGNGGGGNGQGATEGQFCLIRENCVTGLECINSICSVLEIPDDGDGDFIPPLDPPPAPQGFDLFGFLNYFNPFNPASVWWVALATLLSFFRF